MTLSLRIKIAILALLGALLVTVGPAWIGYQYAHGEEFLVGTASPPVELARFDGDGKPVQVAQLDGSATPALSDAGSASAPVAVPAAPADKLADPSTQPKQAWDDLRAAKKDGWAIAAFAALVMLCKLVSRLGKKFKWLAFLGKGKVAIVVGAAGALATACYNAAADGGAWSAMLMAGAVAVAGYLDLGEKLKDG